MKKIVNFLLLSFLLVFNLHAGMLGDAFKDTAKAGAVYGAKKALESDAGKQAAKSVKEKIFTKKKVNDRTAYQQNINPNKVVERTNPRTGETIKEKNLERMKKGQPPYIEKNGKLEPIELHHSRQNDKGSLFELSKSTHKITDKDKGAKALHPYGNKKNPDNPLPKDRSDGFDKERADYWKSRADSFDNKGVSP